MNKKVVFFALAGLFALVIVMNLFLINYDDFGAEANKTIFLQLGANSLLLVAMLAIATRVNKKN